MPKLGLTITDEMEEGLRKESQRTGAPIAALVREAIAKLLNERGIPIEENVTWGGNRRSQDTSPRKK